MAKNEDQILADELAELAATTGAMKPVMRLAAKAMRKNVHEIDMVVPLPAMAALDHAVQVLRKAGDGIEPMVTEGPAGWWTIRAVVSAGTAGLTSVVATALVATDGETESAVKLRGAALEGLVKQRGPCEPAVRRRQRRP